jgi:CRP/FNR family cyclic AMP-dependent transcriptional regulator
MSTRSTVDNALASGWFGAGLTDAARAHLADMAHLTSYPIGEVVIREGQAIDSLAVVVEGRLALRLNVPGRGAVTVLTIEPGDVIGWSALIPPHRATSTIVVLEPTSVVELEGAALRARLDEDPILAAAVLWRLLDAVARRLSATRTQLLDLFAQPDREPW